MILASKPVRSDSLVMICWPGWYVMALFGTRSMLQDTALARIAPAEIYFNILFIS